MKVIEQAATNEGLCDLSELERFARLAQSLVPMTHNEIERECIKIKTALALDLALTVVYKIERNRYRSKFYVIRKVLHEQADTFNVDDSALGLVSNLLTYADAKVCCDQLNREHVRNLNYLGRVHSCVREDDILGGLESNRDDTDANRYETLSANSERQI
jgi:hypothetical protein